MSLNPHNNLRGRLKHRSTALGHMVSKWQNQVCWTPCLSNFYNHSFPATQPCVHWHLVHHSLIQLEELFSSSNWIRNTSWKNKRILEFPNVCPGSWSSGKSKSVRAQWTSWESGLCWSLLTCTWVIYLTSFNLSFHIVSQIVIHTHSH